MLVLLALLVGPATALLRLDPAGPGVAQAREGDNATLECRTTRPWYLCVWKGPGGLALHLAEGDRFDPRHPVKSRSGNKVCQLKVPGVRRAAAGETAEYRCVLADRDKVETVSRTFQLEVRYPVGWVGFSQGPRSVPIGATNQAWATTDPQAPGRLPYTPGVERDLRCVAGEGNPRPTFDVYVQTPSTSNLTFKDAPEQQAVQENTVVKRVLFTALEKDNNTLVSCRVEQRDAGGVLVFSTTESVVLHAVFGPVAVMDSSCLAEWWCGYELVLYLVLVFALLLLVTCCGICYCCATRRRAKRLNPGQGPEVVYQAHENQGLLTQSKGILKNTWEPTFFPPPAAAPVVPTMPLSTNMVPTNMLPTNMVPTMPLPTNMVPTIVEPPSPVPHHPPRNIQLLETNFDRDSRLFGESPGRPASQPSTIGNCSMLDMEADHTLDSEPGPTAGLLTTYQETVTSTSRQTRITTIEEQLRKINLNRSLGNVSDTSSLEEEVKVLTGHLYSLRDTCDVTSRDMTYSQVVKEHLSHNPSLNVSRTDMTFSVPSRHVDRLRWSESQAASRTQSPLPATSTPTLPSSARLPAHRPTDLSAPPPSGPVQDPLQPGREETFSKIVEKHLSSSRELLASSTPRTTRSSCQEVLHTVQIREENIQQATLYSQETLADKTKSVDSDKELEVKQESDEYKLVGLVTPSDDEDEKTNFVEIVEKHLGLSTEALGGHEYALRRTISLDRSCFTTDTDIIDIVDPNPNLTVDDVKKAFTCLRDEGGKVDKETFVKTMMDFFPRYNMEANRTKLEKLFDRLDHKDEGLISFRQFMLVTIAFSTVSLEDKLTRIFKLIDENENGELSFEEFQEVVHDILVLKEERKMSASHVGSRFSADTFRYMGMNADGNIILRDFVDACKQQKFIIINYVENFRDGFQTS